MAKIASKNQATACSEGKKTCTATVKPHSSAPNASNPVSNSSNASGGSPLQPITTTSGTVLPKQTPSSVSACQPNPSLLLTESIPLTPIPHPIGSDSSNPHSITSNVHPHAPTASALPTSNFLPSNTDPHQTPISTHSAQSQPQHTPSPGNSQRPHQRVPACSTSRDASPGARNGGKAAVQSRLSAQSLSARTKETAPNSLVGASLENTAHTAPVSYAEASNPRPDSTTHTRTPPQGAEPHGGIPGTGNSSGSCSGGSSSAPPDSGSAGSATSPVASTPTSPAPAGNGVWTAAESSRASADRAPQLPANISLLPTPVCQAGLTVLLKSFWRLLRKARRPGAKQNGDLLARQLFDPADEVRGNGESCNIICC